MTGFPIRPQFNRCKPLGKETYQSWIETAHRITELFAERNLEDIRGLKTRVSGQPS